VQEAAFYHRTEDGHVQCALCPRRCTIADGGTGFCRTRENRAGTLYTLVYGQPCTVRMTRPENAPLYHFMPGHRRLALATVGCNLHCRYCQNWTLSQAMPGDAPSETLSPQDVIDLALRQGAESVSFTYTEPTVFYEYAYDISYLAQQQGLYTSIVTNGYINPAPLRRLLGVIDAVKVDLKGFTASFYRQVCAATLAPVLTTLQRVRAAGVHLEIVYLVVPGHNDDPQTLRAACEWIAAHLGTSVPLHLTRFFPHYQMTDLPPTPLRTLERARRIAEDAGLSYIYLGNVPDHIAGDTYCPNCAALLVRRTGFAVLENHVADGRCPSCGQSIPGIWTPHKPRDS
jgi:pyruvate formate lyase activating enzyme